MATLKFEMVLPESKTLKGQAKKRQSEVSEVRIAGMTKEAQLFWAKL